ncbi:hypothetical protein HXX76_014186 [Chlamydomonas incerta]|uniref:Uncharacterized protein n=1 Tax=Chlamydomonas incerta TaxID=51695 RepID=A0A835SMM0_CHLIN|nr:hypothetical protein HXX76_014186 [Chlamydomonas incerta]|eukprot:KAG2425029.1 hypothetical protein HXX76_014186 [Chlamydomonas incerta]
MALLHRLCEDAKASVLQYVAAHDASPGQLLHVVCLAGRASGAAQTVRAWCRRLASSSALLRALPFRLRARFYADRVAPAAAALPPASEAEALRSPERVLSWALSPDPDPDVRAAKEAASTAVRVAFLCERLAGPHTLRDFVLACHPHLQHLSATGMSRPQFIRCLAAALGSDVHWLQKLCFLGGYFAACPPPPVSALPPSRRRTTSVFFFDVLRAAAVLACAAAGAESSSLQPVFDAAGEWLRIELDLLRRDASAAAPAAPPPAARPAPPFGSSYDGAHTAFLDGCPPAGSCVFADAATAELFWPDLPTAAKRHRQAGGAFVVQTLLGCVEGGPGSPSRRVQPSEGRLLAAAEALCYVDAALPPPPHAPLTRADTNTSGAASAFATLAVPVHVWEPMLLRGELTLLRQVVLCGGVPADLCRFASTCSERHGGDDRAALEACRAVLGPLWSDRGLALQGFAAFSAEHRDLRAARWAPLDPRLHKLWRELERGYLRALWVTGPCRAPIDGGPSTARVQASVLRGLLSFVSDAQAAHAADPRPQQQPQNLRPGRCLQRVVNSYNRAVSSIPRGPPAALAPRLAAFLSQDSLARALLHPVHGALGRDAALRARCAEALSGRVQFWELCRYRCPQVAMLWRLGMAATPPSV